MRKLIQEIHNGKNINENLKHYADIAVKTYVDYGTLEMTFSAYSLLEDEIQVLDADEKEKMLSQVKQAIGCLADESCDFAVLGEKMNHLRDEITDKMDVLTAYTDRMICYEYVLNRMELKYLSKKELSEKLAAFEEEEYMKMLEGYLFGSKDQKVALDKIRLIMGQIPVHMTKNKLFERIGEALTLYQDGDKSALDGFLYMVRTSAMLYEPKQEENQFPEILEALQTFEQTDFESLEGEKYNQLVSLLEKTAKEIHEITDFYYEVQNVVNGVYAMALILPYREKMSRIEKAGRNVWQALAQGELKEELLVPLEGSIEECVEKSSHLESILYEIRSSYKKELMETGLAGQFHDFVLVANLLSDSLFIDLSVSGEEEEKADLSYVRKCTDELVNELSKKLSQVSKPVKKAIMGLVLEKLPLTFQNSDEVLDYIRVNLMGCQDKAEKCVVLTMLADLIREEQEWT